MNRRKSTFLIAAAVLLLCGAVFVGGVAGDHPESGHEGWTNWGDATEEQTALPTSAGNYFLTANIDLTDEWTVPTGGPVNLCLNGYVIKQTISGKRVINVQSGATLNLYDCVTTPHYFTFVDTDKWTYNGTTSPGGTEVDLANFDRSTAAGKVIKVTGGCITGGSASNGGGVLVGKNGSLTLSGGNIVGNKSTGTAQFNGGGGVYVSGGSFTMNGGSIAGNYEEYDNYGGGGVHVIDNDGVNGTFTMNGGSIIGNAAKHDGGGVFVDTVNRSASNPFGKFTMNGGSIKENAARMGGGVEAWSGEFKMTGGEIKGNRATENGGGVYVNSDCPTTMSGGSITGNKTTGSTTKWTYGGGGVFINGGSFTMSGTARIQNNTAGPDGDSHHSGGGVFINGGSFTMNSGSSVTGNEAKHDGGGVFITSSNASFTMNGGEITNNTAAHHGGGVCTWVGTFTMNGGEIKGNKVTDTSSGNGYGGGVYVNGACPFYMNGGTISENEAMYGGGVSVGGSSDPTPRFTMTGGEIKNNTATQNGGGVYVANYTNKNDNSKFYVSGTPVIKDNKLNNGTTNNVWLANERKITITSDKLSPAARIGVYPAGGAAPGTPFTDGWSNVKIGGNYPDGIYAVFTADGVSSEAGTLGQRLNWPVVDDSGELAFQTDAPKHQHDGGTAWTSTTTLPTIAGSYFLTADVTLDGTWSAPSGVTNLCLNGHVIKLGTGKTGSVISIPSGSTLNLYDCSETKHYFTNDNGLWKLMASGSSDHSVTGGCITGGSASTGGGVDVSGTFTLSGGNIVGNTAQNGGGVYVTGTAADKKGTFTMTGDAIIKGNTSTTGGPGNGGGGVYVAQYGEFEMTGGRIENNTATAPEDAHPAGGGVRVEDNGTFTLSGSAVITGNKARWGGGVHVDGTFIMNTGSNISSNTATSGGGGVNMDKGTFTMSGGSIENNTAITGDAIGGGVRIIGGTFKMQNSTDASPTHGTITGNTAKNGGGVYVTGANSTFTMEGTASIKGNSASNGGGVYISDNGTFEIEGSASIKGNTATTQGGGVYIYSGSFTMKAGTISENSATNPGGGVYINSGSFIMENGSIAGNTASSGGGVHITSGSFMMSGGTIGSTEAGKGNSANSGSGGGVSVTGGEFKMSGDAASIEGNTAKIGGGGVSVTGGSFIMEDGSIAGNSAAYGGGVYVNNSTFTMSGGTIGSTDPDEGNTAPNGGGVYVFSGTFSVSGAPVISGNTKKTGDSASPNNVDLKDNNMLILVGNFSGKIYINNPAPTAGTGGNQFGTATGNYTGAANFISDATDDSSNHYTGVLSSPYILKWSVPQPPAPTTYTVSFTGNKPSEASGTVQNIPASVTGITPGSTIPAPSSKPTLTCYTFCGWFTNTGCTPETEFIFSDDVLGRTATPVSSSMTLYAKWTLVFYSAKLSSYTYGIGPLPTPYIEPAGLTDASFFYSPSADGAAVSWDTVTSAFDLDAGTWYIGATATGEDGTPANIRRSVFTVEKGPQAPPAFSAKEEYGDIRVTIEDYKPGESYLYSITTGSEQETWMPVTGREFLISGLQENTTYNIRIKINAKGNFTEAVSSPFTVKTGSLFSVSFDANGGTGYIAPMTGSTESPVIVGHNDAITREGYTFTSWNNKSDGSGQSFREGDPVNTGAVLYAQWAAQEYTIRFEVVANHGTISPTSINTRYGEMEDLSQITVTSDSGWIFAGWSTAKNGKSVIYAPGQKVQNLGNITLYPVWIKEEEVCYQIEVPVEENGILVSLKRGNTVIREQISYGGKVIFEEVPEGTYNIVAVKTTASGDKKVKTSGITLKQNMTVDTIVFPAENVNSEVKIKEEAESAQHGDPVTPAVVVSHVDEEAVARAQENTIITITVAVAAKSERAVTKADDEAEQKTQTEIQKIKGIAGNRELQHLEIKVTKTETTGQTSQTSPVTDTARVLEFLIPYDFTDKNNVMVYRCHEGEAVPLTPVSGRLMSEDGNIDKAYDGSFWADTANSMIYFYATKFSTYSIGFISGSSPSHSTSSHSGTSVWATQTYTVTFSMNGHGDQIPAQYVTAGSCAKEPVPAPAADGFVFSGWYTDQGCTVLYDFSTPVTADLTLYAGWNAVTPAVPARETPAGKSPAPLAGVIAGLGAALAVFGLRMRR